MDHFVDNKIKINLVSLKNIYIYFISEKISSFFKKILFYSIQIYYWYKVFLRNSRI